MNPLLKELLDGIADRETRMTVHAALQIVSAHPDRLRMQAGEKAYQRLRTLMSTDPDFLWRGEP